MVLFNEITEVKERTVIFPDRRVGLPCLTTHPFGSLEYIKWVKENWWMVDYQVFMDDKPKAQELSKRLYEIFKENPHDPAIQDILNELKKLQLQPYHQLSPLEKWTRSAFQFVSYAGGYEVFMRIKQQLNSYSGTILEAMCGHASYFEESPERTVIALDYCAESLKKYPVPSRRRIECDLNQICNGVKLPFFKEGEFDVISICFGFKYPKDIDSLSKEFYRILGPNGRLSFVENPESGYQELYYREFSAQNIHTVLRNGGFRSVETRVIPLMGVSWDKRKGEFYHTEAIK